LNSHFITITKPSLCSSRAKEEKLTTMLDMQQQANKNSVGVG